MFSQSASFHSKLVEFSFIAGISREKILKDSFTTAYTPKCLLSFPDNEDHFSAVAELVYPLNVNILPSTAEDPISYFCTMLTDEKANRTYIYVLKMFEAIDNMKVPIAICFGSKLNDTDAFKKLLNEVYMIKSSDYSVLTKQIELINYLMFVHSLVIPPSHTLMTLNMRYMSVDFYIHSRCEIPCNLNDTNINILFSVLDVSKIIKLWLNVLRERKVIVYGNKPFLLNSICDAITRLIFPFKWQQTYISCLTLSQLDLLDLPCPSLFGVLSSTSDINHLRKAYPRACIVDLETGRIFCQKTGRLPREMEISLRKKIQILKNPELFEEDDLFKAEKSSKEINDCINTDLSFSCNIQKVFFRILKDTLVGYQSYLDSKSRIEEKGFLSTISSEEIQSIWEKLITTLMFDLFIQLSKHRDDSYNRIFDELCNEGKYTQRNVTNCLKVELTMPSLNVKSVRKLLDEMNVDEGCELDKMIGKYLIETKQTNFRLSARKLSNASLSPFNPDLVMQINYLQMGEDDNNSCDSSNNNDNDFELVDSNTSPLLNLMSNPSKKASFKLLYKQEDKAKGSKLLSSPLISSFKENHFINSVSNDSAKSIDFYSEKGFIELMKRFLKVFAGKKYQLIDVLFKKVFIEEMIEASSILYDSLKDINDIIEEKEGEDCDSKTPVMHKLDPLFQSHSNSKSKGRSANNNANGTKESGKSYRIDREAQPIVKMSNFLSNLGQKYLFYAFTLEEALKYPAGTFSLEANEIKNYIISFYHKALIADNKEFPYYRYSTVIQNCTQEQLKSLEGRIELAPVKEIIQEAITNLFVQLRSLNESNSKKSLDSPRINKKIILFSPSLTQKFQGIASQFKTPPKSSIRGSRSSSNNRSAEEESESNNKAFVILSLQMKKEIKEMKRLKKTRDSEMINSTFIQNKEIIESIKQTRTLGVNNIVIKDRSSFCLGKECDFKAPTTLNTDKNIKKTSEPLSLMVEIGQRVLSFLPKAKEFINNRSLSEEARRDFAEIQDLINKLQRVNLTKLPKPADQYSFWLNAFNFLLIHAILHSNFRPQTLQQWGKLMTNCLYKIGGYEMSLYEIENKILSCCNFHKEEIKFTDPVMEKFCIVEDNILIDFALCFPTKDNPFHLTVYLNEQFEEQIYQTAKTFLDKNVKFSKEDKSISITSYFNQIMPQFSDKTFRLYRNHIDSTLYAALDNKQFTSQKIVGTSWEFSFD